MSPHKTVTAAAAALALMARGISAIGPYSDSSTTLSGEPQLVGSATSNGVLLYSFNYCTTVQTTACAVTVSIGPAPSQEYSTTSTASTASNPLAASTGLITITVPMSFPPVPGSSSETTIATTSASSTDDSAAHWTPSPAITTQSRSESVSMSASASESEYASTAASNPATNSVQTSQTVIVVPTTDAAGSPTLFTTTSTLPTTASVAVVSSVSGYLSATLPTSLSTATSSSGHSSSSRTIFSASSSSSKTGASNTTVISTSTSTSTRASDASSAPAATSADDAAPSKTGAGASIHIFPAVALGAAIFMSTMFLI